MLPARRNRLGWEGGRSIEPHQRDQQAASDATTIDELAAQHERRLLTGFVLATTVVCLGVGLLIGMLQVRHRHSTSGLILALAVIAAGVIATGTWATWLYRRPSYRQALQYHWRRRLRVAKTLRKGHPVAEQDLPVAAALVTLQRKLRWLPLIYLALAALWIISFLTGHGDARWFNLAGAVCYLLLLPALWRQRRNTITNYEHQIGAPDQSTTQPQRQRSDEH